MAWRETQTAWASASECDRRPRIEFDGLGHGFGVSVDMLPAVSPACSSQKRELRPPPHPSRPRVEPLAATAETVGDLRGTTGLARARDMLSRRERLQRLWPAVLLLVTSVVSKESYAEHLAIRPLDDGKLAAAFNFTLRSPDWSRQLTQPASNVQRAFSSLAWMGTDGGAVSHSHLLPRSMAAIVRAHHVRELHFTLVAGRWQYDRWGYPLLGDGAAYGAEAWAWLGDDASRRSASGFLIRIGCAAVQLRSMSVLNADR